MPLTYAESATLMSDPAFRDRVKIACLKYADYIANEASSVGAHNTRYKWALDAMKAPDATASGLTPTVVMQASVQDQGGAITDSDLQVAVELSVNRLM